MRKLLKKISLIIKFFDKIIDKEAQRVNEFNSQIFEAKGPIKEVRY